MIAQNAFHHNGDGIYSRQLYPSCPSDYEAAPVIDVVPTAPKPGWHDAFPAFTHNLSWIDGEGCSHSMTLRSDSLSGLMADLKLLKGMIRQAKQKAAKSQPAQADAASESEQPDVQQCRIHKVDMIRRWSKRTNGHYFAHKAPDGNFCYGLAAKA